MDTDSTRHTQGNLLSSWRVQRRIIGALLMREILTRYGRHNIGFMWLFVEPMMFTLGVTALWTLAGLNHGSNLPIVAFAVTGYSSVLLWRNMPSRCIGAVGPNLALMYHRNVKVMDVFAARQLLEAGGATASFTLLTLVFSAVGWMHLPEDPLKVAAGWLLLAWFGASLAVFLGAWSEQSELIEKLWHPMAYLLFPMSGAAFMVDALPNNMREIVLWLPMIHGTEMVRDGFFGSLIQPHYDVAYFAALNTALTLLGLAKTQIVARGVTPE